MIEISTKAPDFTLLDQNGEKRSLSDFLGTYVLLYFYPADDTPGCTKEACAIRDFYQDFKTAGITVIGVSKNSVESHKKFETKYELPFILLADTEKEVIDLYHADGIISAKRISYVIDPKGMIVAVYPKVDPAGHALEILEKVRAIISE